MPLFLITFLSLYGGMHAYAYMRLRGSFALDQTYSLLLAGWMILMTLAPLLVRITENGGNSSAARLIAWPCYSWMGMIFIFASTLGMFDMAHLAAKLGTAFFAASFPGFITSRNICSVALLFSLFASIYAIFEARRIITDHSKIFTSKLPAGSAGIRIVQISDLHVGLLMGEARLHKILQVIREAKPDILVSTGDLVDGRLSLEDENQDRHRLAALMSDMHAPAGKYAVTGNHEFYAGLKQALAFTHEAGFTVLRNSSVLLPAGIVISGVDDPAGRMLTPAEQLSLERTILERQQNGRFHLFLKHRPVVNTESDGRFDLQLSGHVHKGQIFPFNLLVRLQFPIPCGTTATRQGSLIHVSRGTGTWGPPMRLFAPPEVSIIDIVPSGKTSQ